METETQKISDKKYIPPPVKKISPIFHIEFSIFSKKYTIFSIFFTLVYTFPIFPLLGVKNSICFVVIIFEVFPLTKLNKSLQTET